MQPYLVNWKTSLAGVLTAVGMVISSIALPLLDNDVATVPNWSVAIPAVIAAIGLIFARDADKSSQDTGIRP